MSRLYYEAYEKHEKKGLAAYRAGDNAQARYHLLKAAEYMLLAAKESQDNLKAARLQKARKLKDLATKLPEKGMPSDERSRRRQDAAASEAEGDGDEKSFAAMEKPSIDFSHVAGLEEVKEEIRMKMIYPYLHPEEAAVYKLRRGGGVLLYGPPGTGKTLIARATAGELDAAFFTVRPSQILSKWVGDSEQNIARLFAQAREQPKAVVFIDEVEALVPQRGENSSPVMQRVVPQILTELEGVDTANQTPLLFMGATNTPWMLDPAVMRPGRFDELVYIGLPEPKTRRKILELQLADRPVEPGLELDSLVDRTEGFSGADLRALVEKVAGSTFREAIESGELAPMRLETFECVLVDLRPSVQPDLLERFRQFDTERIQA